MAFRDKTKTALRDLIESQGEDGAVQVIREGLRNQKFTPENFSLRETWEACQLAAGHSTDVHEAVASSAFPKITGELINSRMINAFDSANTIGEQLATTVPSSMQTEKIAGITANEGPEEVGEGQDYKDSSISEKYVTIDNKKYGRMISVTEEMIYFDKTGQVLARARMIGEEAAQYKERHILRGVMDLDSNVYRPSGVAEAFFSAAHGNVVTANPFGEDGLANVRKAAQTMKHDNPNQNISDFGYIAINLDNMIVLVPSDLEVAAWQMANSTQTPESNENAANFFRQRFRPMTSAHVTNNSTTTWYAGDPSRCFWWTEVWPLQTMSQAVGHDDSFKKDIKSRHKIRYYGGLGAIEYRYWFRNTV